MDQYQDRHEAGKILAKKLNKYKDDANVLVLALPRGGVPVAYEVAKALNVQMDIFVVRKLGVPGYSELAMGAIATGNAIVLNDSVIASYGVSSEEINLVRAKEENELKRREVVYRGNIPLPVIKNKTIILIDDGMATGATIKAAIKAVKTFKPDKLIIGLPVAPKEESNVIRDLVDEWICPLEVENLSAVGNWYEDFSQTEDAEVQNLLNELYLLNSSK